MHEASLGFKFILMFRELANQTDIESSATVKELSVGYLEAFHHHQWSNDLITFLHMHKINWVIFSNTHHECILVYSNRTEFLQYLGCTIPFFILAMALADSEHMCI